MNQRRFLIHAVTGLFVSFLILLLFILLYPLYGPSYWHFMNENPMPYREWLITVPPKFVAAENKDVSFFLFVPNFPWEASKADITFDALDKTLYGPGLATVEDIEKSVNERFEILKRDGYEQAEQIEIPLDNLKTFCKMGTKKAEKVTVAIYCEAEGGLVGYRFKGFPEYVPAFKEIISKIIWVPPVDDEPPPSD